MTRGLAEAYTEAGRLNRSHVVPVGTYLTACTVLAWIYGGSPVGNAYTAGLDPAVAWHLQQTAWDTEQAYRR
jgi:hypothetical protein